MEKFSGYFLVMLLVVATLAVANANCPDSHNRPPPAKQYACWYDLSDRDRSCDRDRPTWKARWFFQGSYEGQSFICHCCGEVDHCHEDPVAYMKRRKVDDPAWYAAQQTKYAAMKFTNVLNPMKWF